VVGITPLGGTRPRPVTASRAKGPLFREPRLLPREQSERSLASFLPPKRPRQRRRREGPRVRCAGRRTAFTSATEPSTRMGTARRWLRRCASWFRFAQAPERSLLAAKFAAGSPARQERRPSLGKRRLDQERLHRQAPGRRFRDDPGLLLGGQQHFHDASASTCTAEQPSPGPDRSKAPLASLPPRHPPFPIVAEWGSAAPPAPP
jgi:hypothetical protein